MIYANDDLGSKSAASSVSGSTAFVKIATLNSALNSKISIAHSDSNYVTFSNGLQICWGTVTTSSNAYGTAYFARAFSSTPTLQATATTENESLGYFAQIKGTSTSCTVHSFYAGNNVSGIGANLSFNYLAIGFANI